MADSNGRGSGSSGSSKPRDSRAQPRELKPIYLDELWEYSISDPAELTPGSRLIIASVPDLDSRYSTSSLIVATGRIVTVDRVTSSKLSEAVSSISGYPGEKIEDILLFTDGEGNQGYSTLDALGVIPYPSGYYSLNSFVVPVERLEAEGFEPVLRPTEAYLAKTY